MGDPVHTGVLQDRTEFSVGMKLDIGMLGVSSGRIIAGVSPRPVA